jgi:hypothetical protein
MAATTTPEKVQAVFPTELDPASFITTATAYYEAVIGNNTLGDALGSEVLTYLAAHFLAVTDPLERQESVGTGSWTFEGKQGNGMGLKSTQHGQMAMTLDTSGKLRDSEKRKARFTVL